MTFSEAQCCLITTRCGGGVTTSHQHIDGEMWELSVARLKLQIQTRMTVTMLTLIWLLLVSSVHSADLEIRIPNDELSQQDGYYRLDYRSVTRLASSSVTPP